MAGAGEGGDAWNALLATTRRLAWQALAVLALVKGGAVLFRKRVMKSGGAGRAKTKGGWGRRAPAVLEPAE